MADNKPIKQLRYEGLPPCSFCGALPMFEANSGKRFRIRCPECGACTPWTKKVEAVISWFNRNKTIRDLLLQARTGAHIGQD